MTIGANRRIGVPDGCDVGDCHVVDAVGEHMCTIGVAREVQFDVTAAFTVEMADLQSE